MGFRGHRWRRDLWPLLAAAAVIVSIVLASVLSGGSNQQGRRDCFASPASCGLPTPANGTAGATSPCARLPASGSIVTSSAGQRIANVDVAGTITVQNSNVTIDNVCVTDNAGGQIGSVAVRLEGSASNTLIEHSTIAGANDSNGSVEQAVANYDGAPATLSHDYLHACGECVHDSWTVRDSYVVSDGMQGTSDHVEDVYYDSPGGATLVHDVLLNPEPQTAVIFGDDTSGGPCASHLVLSDSLIAGGAEAIWTCGGMKASSVGTSTTEITNNLWARCGTDQTLHNYSTGGTTCEGATADAIGAGADSNGYWPLVGYQWPTNLEYCPPVTGQVFSGNLYDGTDETVNCANPYGPQG
jgi:hypothetical protein